MKVYIITFSFSGNNGAVLQMFALRKYLVNLGCEVKVVDYQPEWFEKREKEKSSSIKELIINLYRDRGRKKLLRLLNNNIEFTKICRDYRDIESLEQPDYYFAGSDQIWNPEITGGSYDKGYFLEFATPARKVFYGASIGSDIIGKETAKTICKKIENAFAISVREEGLFKALSEYRHDVVHVLDPVFLIDVDDYRSMRSDVSTEKYVLIYQMSDDVRCYQLATRISHEYGYKVIDYGKIRKREGVYKTVMGEAPDVFLGYLANAEYVVTNSFHGVALSVKFHRQFYAIKLNQRQSRISSLLERIGLESRIVDDAESVELTHIDYVQKDKEILAESEKSRDYIKSVLGIVENN